MSFGVKTCGFWVAWAWTPEAASVRASAEAARRNVLIMKPKVLETVIPEWRRSLAPLFARA